MDEQSLRDYCLSKHAAEETFPFGPEVRVFKVGGKVFALVPVGAAETSISLKCEPTWAVILRNTYTAVKPGWHLNKEHWNTITCDGSIPADEILTMIDHSYDLIVSRLTKVQRKALGRS
jgi:predicted DNA-binding protein (MmcQ/YjbR family)